MLVVILETQGITKKFGGLIAVKNVSLGIKEGDIFGLIGPNGAGKTTFLNTIAGVYGPEEGRVTFQGQDVTGFGADKVCHLGMARTFQIVRSFPQLTALENVMIGAIFGTGKPGTRPAAEKAAEMLDFVEFPMGHDIVARNLNTIQLKRLELARALATDCKLLLLDEVAAGLTPGELNGLITLVRKIRDRGITIIMVEHLMKLIMEVCDRIAVLYFGEKIAEGNPDEICNSEVVADAYLGEKYVL